MIGCVHIFYKYVWPEEKILRSRYSKSVNKSATRCSLSGWKLPQYLMTQSAILSDHATYVMLLLYPEICNVKAKTSGV